MPNKHDWLVFMTSKYQNYRKKSQMVMLQHRGFFSGWKGSLCVVRLQNMTSGLGAHCNEWGPWWEDTHHPSGIRDWQQLPSQSTGKRVGILLALVHAIWFHCDSWRKLHHRASLCCPLMNRRGGSCSFCYFVQSERTFTVHSSPHG